MEANHGTVTKLLIISQLTSTQSSKSQNQTSKHSPSITSLFLTHLISNQTSKSDSKFIFCFADSWMTRKDLCLATMESCSDTLDEKSGNKEKKFEIEMVLFQSFSAF